MKASFNNFYWIETNDNHENWFVVAFDEYMAADFFAGVEGYDIEDLFPRKICEAVFEDSTSEAYFPSFEMMIKNDFEFISLEEPMIVWRKGQKFCQGDIIHNINIQKSIEKLGLYIIAVRESDIFKIGVTKNITQRIKQFETANPFEFYLHEFFVTNKCRQLESLLHKKYSHKRYKKEWFKLDAEELRDACNYARNFIGLSPYLDGFVSPLTKLDLNIKSKPNNGQEDESLPF